MATKKLLVLVDGSERSRRTVDYIRDFMPRDRDLQIVLFHVLQGLPEPFRDADQTPDCPEASGRLKAWTTSREKNIRDSMEEMKARLTAAGFADARIDIQCRPVEEGVARDIIREAKTGYDAVVMSRRGTATALQSIILGSVAVKLLQCISFTPTIFVGPAPPVKKVLLAVDASESSAKAVDFVASLLGDHGGDYEICIFNAVLGLGAISFEFPDVDPLSVSPACPPETGVAAFQRKIAQMVREIKARLLAAGFAPEKVSEKIVSGVHSRSDAIVQEAENGGYGTIVVGRRGLSKVEAFFMGRVGHKVIYGGKEFTVWVV